MNADADEQAGAAVREHRRRPPVQHRKAHQRDGQAAEREQRTIAEAVAAEDFARAAELKAQLDAVAQDEGLGNYHASGPGAAVPPDAAQAVRAVHQAQRG